MNTSTTLIMDYHVLSAVDAVVVVVVLVVKMIGMMMEIALSNGEGDGRNSSTEVLYCSSQYKVIFIVH